MGVFWFWFLVVMIFFTVAALPAWPYTRGRGIYRRPGAWPYAPSGLAAGLALLIVFLFWLGLLAIAWPWYSAPPPAI